MKNKITQKEKKFWRKYKRWHLDDIKKCIDNKAYVGGAKLICCAIDALAGFRFGATNYAGSKFRFVNFVKEFMPAFKRRLRLTKDNNLVYKRSVLEMFYKNFRSGLIHEGLPGIGTELIEDNDKTLLFINPTPDILQINIFGLFEYLKVVFDKYEQKLYTEEDFLNNFRKRLKYITNPDLISRMR